MAPVDQSDSSAEIEKISRQLHSSVVVDNNNTINSTAQKNTTALTSSSSARISGLADSNQFREASNANISVYHAPLSHISNGNNEHRSSLYSPSDGPASVASIKSMVTNPYKNENVQSEKKAFLAASNRESIDYIQSTLHKPISPYEIKAGTIIPATLLTGIQSTLPGTLIAKVRHSVFDTATGNALLIPQGTTLIGNYDSQIAYGQSRVLIVWSRLIFPNGSSFDLQGMPGADLTGMAGLHDIVDNHYLRVFGSALLLSVFGAAGQLSQPNTNSNQLTTQQILYAAMGQQMSQTAMQWMEQNMAIQPTIKIRAGANFNVLLTRDMILSSQYKI